MKKIKTITLEWNGNELILIDQRMLPTKKEYMICKTYEDVYVAIKDMIVRGAPAIGATAAFGYYLGLKELSNSLKSEKSEDVSKRIFDKLASSRPTAVNLFWALKRMEKVFLENINDDDILEILENEAYKIAEDDIKINKSIGKFGQEILSDGDTVLTHCNAGALATVDYGTALGVIRGAIDSGKTIKVFADETRPYLQGARLTAWELMESGIDVTLITDNMAGWIMKQGKINAVIVGADRIAANGDTANKIGTYSVAVLAQKHGIPFYIAAPLSTIDIEISDGEGIPIEERNKREITHIGDKQIAPDNVKCFNPAFDVTPWNLITGIITEKGILRPPYRETIKKLFDK